MGLKARTSYYKFLGRRSNSSNVATLRLTPLTTWVYSATSSQHSILSYEDTAFLAVHDAPGSLEEMTQLWTLSRYIQQVYR